jgi:hypothetical protein
VAWSQHTKRVAAARVPRMGPGGSRCAVGMVWRYVPGGLRPSGRVPAADVGAVLRLSCGGRRGELRPAVRFREANGTCFVAPAPGAVTVARMLVGVRER